MIRVEAGPLIGQPEEWTLVFDRKATSPLKNLIACGRYKHVRAFGYVRFLHVWVFYDPHWFGTDIVIAAEGPPAQRLLAAWLAGSDPVLVRMPCADRSARRGPPIAGWCVPSIKRLLGIRSGALRCDALFAHCLANGGTRLDAPDGFGKDRRTAG